MLKVAIQRIKIYTLAVFNSLSHKLLTKHKEFMILIRVINVQREEPERRSTNDILRSFADEEV